MLGEVLRRRRESKGLSQGDAGASYGVSAQQVSKYERGYAVPIGYVVALSQLVGCSWWDIFMDLQFDERTARRALSTALADDDEE